MKRSFEYYSIITCGLNNLIKWTFVSLWPLMDICVPLLSGAQTSHLLEQNAARYNALTWGGCFQHHYSPTWRKKKKNLIFENEDFLSDSSDNVNPLQLKLNLAAVVLFVPNHEWTSEHMLKVPVWAQHYAVQLQAGIFLFYLFLTKKRHWLHATTGIFQVLGTAETLRNKSYNFNRGGARLQTDFQYKRSDSRDHSLQFSASSALKRC